jgi:murein DD-endopeptidase MepM/ murein hydrolase activator NlpD
MTDSRTGTRYTFTSNTDPDSLDVVLDPPATGTATVPATALTSGKVLAVWNDCQLALVDHGNGLWAVYLHLRDIKVTSGQVVAPGDPLGFPTTILPPVRPCGNVQSDAEHVHFALLKGSGTSGTYVSMQSLCGYQVIELLTRINKPFTVPAC